MATRDQVYAKFGVAAEAAQLFETDLGTILLAFEGEEQGWHLSPSPETAAVFYEQLNKKTLGQILGAVKAYVDLDDATEAVFQRGLSERNRLNHGFYQSHNFAIHSPEGRDTMIADLEVLHQQLFDAWQVAHRLSGVLVERLMSIRAGRVT